jgi:hypothetical protein
MSDETPVTYEKIEASLRELGLQYLKGNDGTFLAIFGSNAQRSEMQVYLSIDGSMHDIFVMRGTSPERFPASDASLLLRLVNQWNSEFRWPKCTMSYTPDGSALSVWADFQIKTQSGISADLLAETIATFIGCTDQSCIWLREQLELPSADDLEEWMKRAS